MQVHIYGGDVSTSPAILDHVKRSVEKAVHTAEQQITRIEVHLRNDSHMKHTPEDMRCLIEARPAGRQPLAVSCRSDDLYNAVTGASLRLKRSLNRMLKRRRDLHR